jgi:hypothetical protein
MVSNPRAHNVVVVSNFEKDDIGVTEHNECITSSHENSYEDAELEPEIHWRTYVALLAMVLINYVAVISLQAPPAVVSIHQFGSPEPDANQIHYLAQFHWKFPERIGHSDLDPKCSKPHMWCDRTNPVICIGHIPSSKEYIACWLCIGSHRLCRCSRIFQYLQSYCWSDHQGIWLCYDAIAVRHPK